MPVRTKPLTQTLIKVLLDPATQARFWSKVNKTDYCWLWIGARIHDYGVFSLHKTCLNARPHRLAYFYRHGKLDHRLQIDHLCRNKLCVRPDHLEQVTAKENYLRGNSPFAKYSRQTHCKYGHPLTGENVRLYERRLNEVHRCCRTCDRFYYHERMRRKGTTTRPRREEEQYAFKNGSRELFGV